MLKHNFQQLKSIQKKKYKDNRIKRVIIGGGGGGEGVG